MDGYHEFAGGQFDVQVTRAIRRGDGDKVTVSLYRGSELLVQFTINREATEHLAHKLMGALK